MEKPNDEEHVVTEREKRAWQAGKTRSHRERPELNIAQRLQFLELIVRMASVSEFERRLGLTTADVQHYRKVLNVESADEARALVRRMKKDNAEKREASIIQETQRVREAEAVAQQRLDEIEAKRTAERPLKPVDPVAIKREDAERQRRLVAQQQQVPTPKKEWRLPLEGTATYRQEQKERFGRDIKNHGMRFVRNKYGVTNAQIRHEANRLGLEIDWDSIRR